MTPETIADGISLFFLRGLINGVVIAFVLGLLWLMVVVLRELVKELRVMVFTDIFRKRVVSTAKHFAAFIEAGRQKKTDKNGSLTKRTSGTCYPKPTNWFDG